MLKNKIIYSAGLICIIAAGCAKKLDVLPTQSIDQTTALGSSKDVEVTLIGCYDGLQSTSLYGGAIQYVADLLGDNGDMRFGGTFQLNFYKPKDMEKIIARSARLLHVQIQPEAIEIIIYFTNFGRLP